MRVREGMHKFDSTHRKKPFGNIAQAVRCVRHLCFTTVFCMLPPLTEYCMRSTSRQEHQNGSLKQRARYTPHLRSLGIQFFWVAMTAKSMPSTGIPGRRSEERRVGKECRSRWE